MKTTSFEISKKLAEIGFEAKFDHCYSKQNPEQGLWNKSFEITCWEGEDISNYYPAFDLETILEALPKEIERDNGFNIGLRFWWADGASWIGYQNFSGFIITVDANQNESLTDTAARLLILLHEEGIVNFNEGIK